MWRLAMRCKACQYPNDDCAVFCQNCGVKQASFTVDTLSDLEFDIQLIDRHISDLQSQRMSSQVWPTEITIRA